MSQRCNCGSLEDVEDSPKSLASTARKEISSISVSESAVCAEPICPSSEVFVCTICVETDIDVLDRVLVPECNHTFCIDCLLSWAMVRVVCPNCKAPFMSLFIHRCQDGEVLQGPWTRSMEPPWRLENVSILQSLSWVQLREIHTPKQDIETSFSLPPLNHNSLQFYAPLHSSQTTSHYLHEEVEDELEERFWQEEEKHYHRLMRRTRVVSNRRFGPKGYIAAGHMQAKARPPPHTRTVGSSSDAGSSQAHASMDQTDVPRQQSGTGRKKKVKKKSRAGIAAAAAAKVAAETGASQVSSAMPPSSCAATGIHRDEVTSVQEIEKAG